MSDAQPTVGRIAFGPARETPARRGRPTVKTGEPSTEMRVSVEVSLYRQLRHLAQEARMPLPDVISTALREFIAKNLTASQSQQ